MTIKSYKPTTAARRHRRDIVRGELSQGKPEKSLIKVVKKHSGRNSSGRVTVRHRGGQQKRYLRKIDFKRNKLNVPAKVMRIEYDPNRSANIALLYYADGDKRYILAPEGLKVGHQVMAGEKAPLKPGNSLVLARIPVGSLVHNLELRPGKGAQVVRSAGAAAIVQAKDKDTVNIQLPSGEVRIFTDQCRATLGEVGNKDLKNVKLGKAGRKRLMGWRPAVRGVAMHPDSHPHGGGEGRSGIGMPSPKSPWGKPTLGKKTRKKTKYSDKYIIHRRKK